MAAQDYEQVTYNSPSGAMVGSSASEKVGFFGITPAAQPTSASQAAVATDAATTGAATYGFTSAQANGIVTLLNRIRADLVTLGLIKGS